MAIAARIFVQVILMIFFSGEEIAKHLDGDFVTRFKVGGEIGLHVDGIKQIGVIDTTAVLVPNVMSLPVHGIGVDETEEVLEELFDGDDLVIVINLDGLSVVGFARFKILIFGEGGGAVGVTDASRQNAF